MKKNKETDIGIFTFDSKAADVMNRLKQSIDYPDVMYIDLTFNPWPIHLVYERKFNVIIFILDRRDQYAISTAKELSSLAQEANTYTLALYIAERVEKSVTFTKSYLSIADVTDIEKCLIHLINGLYQKGIFNIDSECIRGLLGEIRYSSIDYLPGLIEINKQEKKEVFLFIVLSSYKISYELCNGQIEWITRLLSPEVQTMISTVDDTVGYESQASFVYSAESYCDKYQSFEVKPIFSERLLRQVDSNTDINHWKLVGKDRKK